MLKKFNCKWNRIVKITTENPCTVDTNIFHLGNPNSRGNPNFLRDINPNSRENPNFLRDILQFRKSTIYFFKSNIGQPWPIINIGQTWSNRPKFNLLQLPTNLVNLETNKLNFNLLLLPKITIKLPNQNHGHTLPRTELNQLPTKLGQTLPRTRSNFLENN